ncbi:hypothetical protein Krac_2269 [Ktedonobacter racemifer DSM 44963]|uniref:Uncharacterized protein n=1 Tax=Ktedonobacter racemifer DSM 44963 TaxID=485913 RepID=D6U4V9_KTERA|nr:hypothetical protein Krac_2269 [Ktedonobacter racemifer DSM 44963]
MKMVHAISGLPIFIGIAGEPKIHQILPLHKKLSTARNGAQPSVYLTSN